MSERPDPSPKEGSAAPTPRGAGWRPQATPSPTTGFTPVTSSTHGPAPAPPASAASQTTTDTPSRANPATGWRIVLSLFFGAAILVCLFIGLNTFSHAVRNNGYGGTWGWTVLFAAGVGVSVFVLRRIWIRPIVSTPAIGNNPSAPLRGEVRGFQERAENKRGTDRDIPISVWTFRLERYQGGNRLPPIPVELRGERFLGSINEGDSVQLEGNWREGQIARPRRVFNVTQGVYIQAVSAQKSAGKIASIVLGLLMLLIFIAFMAYQLFGNAAR